MSIIFTLTNITLKWKKHAIIPEQIFYTCKKENKYEVINVRPVNLNTILQYVSAENKKERKREKVVCT
jgi:hypothetical protein